METPSNDENVAVQALLIFSLARTNAPAKPLIENGFMPQAPLIAERFLCE